MFRPRLHLIVKCSLLFILLSVYSLKELTCRSQLLPPQHNAGEGILVALQMNIKESRNEAPVAPHINIYTFLEFGLWWSI